MRGLGLPFEVRSMEVEESFPENLKGAAIAEYLAGLKAEAYLSSLAADELLITADTIVWLGDRVFNKPGSAAEAHEMISALSGRSHEVITGVALATADKQHIFHDSALVHFGALEPAEIAHYVAQYQPYDKAGAYGIQEWIGYIGIDRIEGSFYNVMGFPTRKFYTELKAFLTA
jgi:septum formation protein